MNKEEYAEYIYGIMAVIAEKGTDALSTAGYKSNDCIVGIFNIVLGAIEKSEEEDNALKARDMFAEMCQQVYDRMVAKKQNDEDDAIRSEIRRIETEMEPQDDKAD